MNIKQLSIALSLICMYSTTQCAAQSEEQKNSSLPHFRKKQIIRLEQAQDNTETYKSLVLFRSILEKRYQCVGIKDLQKTVEANKQVSQDICGLWTPLRIACPCKIDRVVINYSVDITIQGTVFSCRGHDDMLFGKHSTENPLPVIALTSIITPFKGKEPLRFKDDCSKPDNTEVIWHRD